MDRLEEPKPNICYDLHKLLGVKLLFLASHESITQFLKPETEERATSPSAKLQKLKTDAAGFDVMGYKNGFIDSWDKH